MVGSAKEEHEQRSGEGQLFMIPVKMVSVAPTLSAVATVVTQWWRGSYLFTSGAPNATDATACPLQSALSLFWCSCLCNKLQLSASRVVTKPVTQSNCRWLHMSMTSCWECNRALLSTNNYPAAGSPPPQPQPHCATYIIIHTPPRTPL